MDDVGRLWKSALVLLAASLFMGFITACGNVILGLSDSELTRLSQRSKKGEKLKKLQDNSDVIIQTDLAVRSFTIILLGAFGFRFLLQPIYNALKNAAEGEMYYLLCAAVTLGIAVLSAAVISAIGVNAPKKLCIGDKIGVKFAERSYAFYRLIIALFKPAQLIAAVLSSAALRLCGVKKSDLDDQVTEQEILEMLDAANENGGIEDDQAEMISNIFEFSDLELHEVMTHRTELCAVDDSSNIADVVKLAVDSGFSRIPVYHETIDDIKGVIYVKDLLPLILDSENKNTALSQYLHKVKFMPESVSCSELFRYFTENKKQIAIVLDEYGGTAGIVTMEDLLECIVGNIRDEYDENEADQIEEITPHTYDILGSADPDEAMEALGAALEKDHDYDTMGGFITGLLGYIPEDGQTPSVRWNGITFKVIKAKDNRIEKIRAVKDRKKPQQDSD
ncbi:MAG: hemolysin family protein [Oscillospiraceae bacterium]